MKVVALTVSGLLLASADAAPLEYQSVSPVTVSVTYATPEWVNAECAKRIGREADPGMVYEACAGVGSKWIIRRHGAFYPGERSAYIDSHEVWHVRGWYHG